MTDGAGLYAMFTSHCSDPCAHNPLPEITRLRALNAELVAACEMGGMEEYDSSGTSGPELLRDAARMIGPDPDVIFMTGALRRKAAAEEAAIAKAKEQS